MLYSLPGPVQLCHTALYTVLTVPETHQVFMSWICVFILPGFPTSAPTLVLQQAHPLRSCPVPCGGTILSPGLNR